MPRFLDLDSEGKDLADFNGKPVRIPVEFFREDAEGKPSGSPTMGYVTLEGISPQQLPNP
jgi:hypothetical protein